MIQDLVWFYVYAGGDLGLRGMPLEPSTRGDGVASVGPSDHAVEAATRWRTIASALHRLSATHQRTLRAHHRELPRRLRLALYPAWGELAGVAFDSLGDRAKADEPTRARLAAAVREACSAYQSMASLSASAHRAARRARFESQLRGAL